MKNDELEYDDYGNIELSVDNIMKMSLWQVMVELVGYNVWFGDIAHGVVDAVRDTIDLLYRVLTMVFLIMFLPILPLVVGIYLKVKAKQVSKKQVYEILKG